jgi:PHD/YefM family antitoxin component YafN of YafNO toxin-antitoxin module
MQNLIKISLLSLLLLTACATENGDKKKQLGCRTNEIVILNENTGQYDCVSESEYEQILDELDEVRW